MPVSNITAASRGKTGCRSLLRKDHKTNRHFTLATKLHFQASLVGLRECIHKFFGKLCVQDFTEVFSHETKSTICDSKTRNTFTQLSSITFRHTLECFGAVGKDESCIEGTKDFIHWQVNYVFTWRYHAVIEWLRNSDIKYLTVHSNYLGTLLFSRQQI